jgi:hypothetical protein
MLGCLLERHGVPNEASVERRLAALLAGAESSVELVANTFGLSQ